MEIRYWEYSRWRLHWLPYACSLPVCHFRCQLVLNQCFNLSTRFLMEKNWVCWTYICKEVCTLIASKMCFWAAGLISVHFITLIGVMLESRTTLPNCLGNVLDKPDCCRTLLQFSLMPSVLQRSYICFFHGLAISVLFCHLKHTQKKSQIHFGKEKYLLLGLVSRPFDVSVGRCCSCTSSVSMLSLSDNSSKSKWSKWSI